MMLTIQGLPTSTNYQELKRIIKQECNITDFILDSLVLDDDGCKKVRIGVTDEGDGNLLMKYLNGYHYSGHVIRVMPVGKTSQQGQGNFDARGGYPQRNDYNSNFGNRVMPHDNQGPRSNAWGSNAQWGPGIPAQQPQHTFPNQPIQSVVNNNFTHQQQPRGFVPGGPPQHAQSFGYAAKGNVMEVPITPLKDNFQGQAQFHHQAVSQGHFQGQTHVQPSPWNTQVPPAKPQFDKQPTGGYNQAGFNDNRSIPKQGMGNDGYKDYDKGDRRFAPTRDSSPGRRPSRMSPDNLGRRMSPAGPPGRRVSPPGHQSRRMSPPGHQNRRMSPPPTGPPGRRISPGNHGRRMSPPRMGGPVPPGRGMSPMSGRRMSPSRQGISPHGLKLSPGAQGRRISPGPYRRGSPPGPHGRRMSPVGPQGRRLSPSGPPGRRLSPPSPQGRRLSPPGPQGRRLSPSGLQGRRLSPPGLQGRRLSPPGPQGRRVSPGPQGRRISPPGPRGPRDSPHGVPVRRISPSGRRLSPGRRDLSPGRRISPTDRRRASPGRRGSPRPKRHSPGRRSVSPRRRSPMLDAQAGMRGCYEDNEANVENYSNPYVWREDNIKEENFKFEQESYFRVVDEYPAPELQAHGSDTPQFVSDEGHLAFARPEVREDLNRLSGARRNRYITLMADNVPKEKVFEMRQKRCSEESPHVKPEKRARTKHEDSRLSENVTLSKHNSQNEIDLSKSHRHLEVRIENITRMNEKQSNMIRETIISKIMELSKSEGPRFEDYSYKSGTLMVTCRDKESKRWLQQKVSHIEPWPGAQLSTTVVPVPHKPVIMHALLPKTETQQTNHAFNMFRIQNRGINTEDWKLLSTKSVEEGIIATISVDHLSAEVLKEANYKACIGFKTIRFRRGRPSDTKRPSKNRIVSDSKTKR